MDVARRDKTDPGAHGELCERVVARVVEWRVVIGELDEHTLGTECLDQTRELTGCRLGSVGDERRGHRAVAAAGENEPVTVVCLGQGVERVRRTTLLTPGELGTGDRRRKARVTLGIGGQHEEMRRLRIDRPGARLDTTLRARRQRQLGTEDGRQSALPRRLGEADDPVTAVVIGEREGLETEPRCFDGEVLRVRGAV